jgi:sugar diacid utilization regulator
MLDSHREHQIRKSDGCESLHGKLVGSLLYGEPAEQWTIWDAADYLRLPTSGPFVVVAVEISDLSTGDPPDIEPMLRSLDVSSAWRVSPETQVGIVHVKSEKQFDDVLALLSRVAAGRVGVSARYDDLRGTPQALRFARTMLRGRADPSRRVSVFDASMLTSAAVAAPDVMVALAKPVLECFADMADEEREVLFETFRSWVDGDGSMRTVAEEMFCHANTVRHRLHRIERCTRRSLSRPRDIVELCLAFEVHRRLI